MNVGEILGDLLGIFSIQTILISIELGSKNAIMMAMKNSAIKKSIQESLKIYLNHSVIAMFIFSLYMYIAYGVGGMMIGIFVNGIIILWIYTQYHELIMK